MAAKFRTYEGTVITVSIGARMALFWYFRYHNVIDSLHFGGPILDTPITDAVNLAECTGLVEQGVSPYSGSVCRTPPILLSLHHFLGSLCGGRDLIIPGFAYVLFDVATATFLGLAAVVITRRYAQDYTQRLLGDAPGDTHKDQAHHNSGGLSRAERKATAAALQIAGCDKPDEGTFEQYGMRVAAAWLANPVTIAQCYMQSGNVIHSCVVALAFWLMSRRQITASAIAVATAAHLALYPACLLLPLCSCALSTPHTRGPMVSVLQVLGTFALWFALLAGISYLFEHSWDWAHSVYGVQVRDLTIPKAFVSESVCRGMLRRVTYCLCFCLWVYFGCPRRIVGGSSSFAWCSCELGDNICWMFVRHMSETWFQHYF
eukprot:m.705437 g.705437  ORF g.705437 m.705437 type:complete len:375 (-) comp22926_c0_seq25:2402-3526(-)